MGCRIKFDGVYELESEFYYHFSKETGENTAFPALKLVCNSLDLNEEAIGIIGTVSVLPSRGKTLIGHPEYISYKIDYDPLKISREEAASLLWNHRKPIGESAVIYRNKAIVAEKFQSAVDEITSQIIYIRYLKQKNCDLITKEDMDLLLESVAIPQGMIHEMLHEMYQGISS